MNATNSIFRIFSFFLVLFITINSAAQTRQEIYFNEQWTFKGTSITGTHVIETVDLPHTWNNKDAQEGIKYLRSVGMYTKRFPADPSWVGKRVFIRFEGVNITASVKVNDNEIGVHKGGYAAFCYELSEHLRFDEDNTVEVTVSNEENLEVIPLVGDFNNYGGIYRPVSLLVLNPICITPLDYASSGIFITQKNVSEQQATVEVLTKISNGSDSDSKISYRAIILDQNGEEVASRSSDHALAMDQNEFVHSLKLVQYL